MRALRRFALVLLFGGMAACNTQAAPIRVVGSDLLGAEFAATLQRLAALEEYELSFELTGSRPGLARLKAGAADLGIFALPPGEVPPGDPLVSRVFAAQAIAVVVSDSLPLTQLTHAQVRGLFAAGATETYSTWGDLGLTGEWRGRAIVPLAPAPAAALTLPLAQRLLFPAAELKSTLVLVPTLDAVPARVLAAGGGVALTPTVPATGSGLRALALAPSLTEAAYLPTPESLHDGYTLRLPLYVVLRREALPRLLPLLRQLLGEEMRAALARADFHTLPAGAGRQWLLELENLR